MPNWPVLGSQTVPVMKPGPYWRMAGTPAMTICKMLITVNQAKPWQRWRNVRSINNCSREGGWEIWVSIGTMAGSSQLNSQPGTATGREAFRRGRAANSAARPTDELLDIREGGLVPLHHGGRQGDITH